MIKAIKSLTFQDVMLFILVGYLIFNRLVEQSGSQKLLEETGQKAKAAEVLSKQALKRTEKIEAVNALISESIADLNKLNETSMGQIQEIDQQYRHRKDTTYDSFNNRLNTVKTRLIELQKLQKQL